jgi:hypothetical protein
MVMVRDLEIVWDDLLDAFGNVDPDMIYFLDRNNGDIFSVPSDYEDEAFWDQVEGSPEEFLQIPGFDYDKERALLNEFIKGIGNERLKKVLEQAFVGKRPYGRLDEILSFYPEEMERLVVLKEHLLTGRITHWLEEHDLFPAEGQK